MMADDARTVEYENYLGGLTMDITYLIGKSF